MEKQLQQMAHLVELNMMWIGFEDVNETFRHPAVRARLSFPLMKKTTRRYIYIGPQYGFQVMSWMSSWRYPLRLSRAIRFRCRPPH